jgi:putative transposase
MNTANRVLDELYFITTTVVDWVDIFTRPKCKHIILDSLACCQQSDNHTYKDL